jgi:hypothetical protein
VFSEIIKQHLNDADAKWTFADWLHQQSKSDQEGFALLMQKKSINVANLYRSMTTLTDLPFKSTTFKSHVRGDCKCQTQ